MSQYPPQPPYPPAYTPPPQQPFPYSKPGKVQAIGIITLINGILNILTSLGVALVLVLTLAGICCVPIFLLPIALGIYEIVYASKIISNPPKKVAPSMPIAIMEICCILFGNIISLAVGVINLVLFNDPEVKAWFNSTQNLPG